MGDTCSAFRLVSELKDMLRSDELVELDLADADDENEAQEEADSSVAG